VAARLRLVLEYQGTNYHGFQAQKDAPTIQDELEKALYHLTEEKIRVSGASRTDSGVSARGQVVAFRTRSELGTDAFVSGLNHYLPPDIAVREASFVDDGFHPRGDATSREYRYLVLNRANRSAHFRDNAFLVSGRLDIPAMNRAAGKLVGTHDFAAFASRIAGSNIRCTVRHICRAEVTRQDDFVVFYFRANAFLPHQVRNTVGSLLRVGQGKMTLGEFYSIMESKIVGSAGPAVPAAGLCLMRVNYGEQFEVNIDENL
jgi:tRNA pseudouridine38-40 synthase